MPQLTCQNLSLGYEGEMIITDLSFAVDEGDYLCIVGENGSGKSTLMKTLLGLLSPLSGRIDVGSGLVGSEIGYLPQQTAVQRDFPASVREVVRSGCLNRCGLRPFFNSAEKQIAQDYMELLGIDHLAGTCYRELSGGQQQRVLLARALCATQKILLLDEPIAGLDPKAAADMYTLIKKLNNEGTTIIMISHDIAASVRYASHILHVGNGTTMFFGTTTAYLESYAGSIYLSPGGVQT